MSWPQEPRALVPGGISHPEGTCLGISAFSRPGCGAWVCSDPSTKHRPRPPKLHPTFPRPGKTGSLTNRRLVPESFPLAFCGCAPASSLGRRSSSPKIPALRSAHLPSAHTQYFLFFHLISGMGVSLNNFGERGLPIVALSPGPASVGWIPCRELRPAKPQVWGPGAKRSHPGSQISPASSA